MNDLSTDIERVLVTGDLSKLSADQRLSYYNNVCEKLGLNPLTRPFDYLTLNGKLQLYARKDATDQLRKIHSVSVTITSREKTDDVYIVTARAKLKDREDESIGAVNIGGLKGDALANAIMKSETKSKRRVTLSICGLGMLDESELETIPEVKEAQKVQSLNARLAEPQPTVTNHQEPVVEWDAETTTPAPEKKVYSNVDTDHKPGTITEKQRKRLFAIYKKASWTDEQVKEYLLLFYGIEHSKDIPWRAYDQICKEIESGSFEQVAEKKAHS